MIVKEGVLLLFEIFHLLMFEHVHAAAAKAWVSSVFADISFVVPAAFAFVATSPGDFDRGQLVVLTGK